MSASVPFTAARKAAGAGFWYPGTKSSLDKMIDECCERARTYDSDPKMPHDFPKKDVDVHAAITARRALGVFVPHAGFRYSGSIVACGLDGLKESVMANGGEPETVVVLGFGHKISFDGVAILDGASLAFPNGTVELDSEAARFLVSCPEGKDIIFPEWNRTHNGEHSAENEIPFIHRAFPKAKLVVALIGSKDKTTVSAAANAFSALRRTLRPKMVLVASTDMLHDPDYDLVRATDLETLEMSQDCSEEGAKKLRKRWSPDSQCYCGISTVLTLLTFARLEGAKEGVILHYENSGDRNPDSRGSWVVGYGTGLYL